MADLTITDAIQAIRDRAARINREASNQRQKSKEAAVLAAALSEVAVDLECDADRLERDLAKASGVPHG